MKYSTIIVAAAAVTGAVAQLGNIPQCALGCAISSLGSTGCQTTDIKCICQASGFIAALTPCVEKACSAAELEQTIQAASGLCASAGVTLTLPSATSAMPSTSASEAPVTSSAYVSTTTEAVSTSTEVVSTMTTSMMTSMYVAPNATMTMSHNGTVTTGKPTGTSAIPSASQTGSAGRNSVAIGGLVLAFAAALL